MEGRSWKTHLCESVLTHYGTFILRLQSTVGSSSEIPSHGSETSIAFGSCRFFNCASVFPLPPPNPLTLGFGGVRERCEGCGCCGSRCRQSGTISALLSRHGLQKLLPPAAEKLHRSFPAVVLGSAASFVRARDDRRNNRTLEIIFREFCPKSSNLFSAGTARSRKKKYDFSVKWVLGQIPNKPHRWENVPTDALLASL